MMRNIKLLISELWLVSKFHSVFFNEILHSFRLTVFKSRIIKYEGIKIDTKNKFFSLPIRKQFLYKYYEFKELSMLGKSLSSTDKVLEVGSGLGVTAIFVARIVGAQNILTYEASPELIPVIKKNFELNNLNIRVENKILILPTDADNSKKFYNNDDFFLGSTIANAADSPFFETPTEDFIKILEKEQPSYLLIDIEGEEINLLNTVLPSYIKKICIEVHPSYKNVGDERISDLLFSLMQQGFKLTLTNSIGASLYLSRK